MRISKFRYFWIALQNKKGPSSNIIYLDLFCIIWKRKTLGTIAAIFSRIPEISILEMLYFKIMGLLNH